MTLAITGATGQLGRTAADLVLERVAPQDLVLVTRGPAALAAYAQRGVAVRRGDFDDPATLADAFAGVDRLLLISTDAVGRRVAQHRAAIDAAVAAGVRALVYTSMVNPSDSNPAPVQPEHAATEQALITSGVEWTMLRNAIYAETLIGGAQGAVATGTLVSNVGRGTNGHVSRDDCAAVAAAVLTGEGHAGRAYDVTGPEAVGAHDLAALYGEIAGTTVRVADVDDEAWVAAMAESGMPVEVARVYAAFGASQRLGYASPVSAAVRDLTGREPRSVRQVLEPVLAGVAG